MLTIISTAKQADLIMLCRFNLFLTMYTVKICYTSLLILQLIIHFGLNVMQYDTKPY